MGRDSRPPQEPPHRAPPVESHRDASKVVDLSFLPSAALTALVAFLGWLGFQGSSTNREVGELGQKVEMVRRQQEAIYDRMTAMDDRAADVQRTVTSLGAQLEFLGLIDPAGRDAEEVDGEDDSDFAGDHLPNDVQEFRP